MADAPAPPPPSATAQAREQPSTEDNVDIVHPGEDADGGHQQSNNKRTKTSSSSKTHTKEWTMKPSEMADWVERVTSQSLEVLHRFAELESATDAVLEVGAGRGTYSRRALDRMVLSPASGAKLLLTDASEDMVAQMRSSITTLPTATNLNPKVEIEQVSAVDLPYADNSIDSYLANLVLHHTSDAPRALQEAFRVLKKGKGRLCVTEVDALNTGTMFSIPQQAMMKLWNVDGGGSAKTGNHNPFNHHAHSHHGHETATSEASKGKNQQHGEHAHHNHQHHSHDPSTEHEHSSDINTQQHQQHQQQEHQHPPHDHKHAVRHGGADDWRRMVRDAGFVDAVAWHVDCIGETHDANRFARNALAHQQSKDDNNGAPTTTMMTEQQEEQFVQEMRRLAQIELDAGRPITLGTVVLTAHKPAASS